MTSPYTVGSKTRRTMGFALMVAFLSLGVISGCDPSIDDDYDFLEPDRPGGGLGVVDPDAGIYPNIQVIQPFLSGAIDPIKVQYWDQTYYWGPDSAGNDACFKGTVGILGSPNLAQETAPDPECPTPLGQVTPCNPAAAADTVASGAVQPAISGCELGGAACTDILVPGITDEVTCESTVRMADPIAAGAAWFQNIDAPGTKGGTASHWWYGTRAGKSFDAEDGYGGTQIDYISDATNINIVATGGGSDDPGINNIYLCSDKDVVNPAENPDVCTLSSLFGSCDKGDLKECKINNIGLIDGAFNIYIRSATPSNGSGGGLGEAGSISTTIESAVEFQTAQINVEKTGQPGEGIDISNNYNNWPNPFLQNFTPAAGVTLPGLARSEKCSWRVVKNASESIIVDAGITPFIWGPITEQSVLNGPFGNPIPLATPGAPDGDAYICINSSTGAANIRNSDVKVWQASYDSGSVIKPQITFTDSEGTQQTVDVTLGFGHGVGYYDPVSKATKNLRCGQVALVRQCQDQGGVYTNDSCASFEYIAVMRTGTIAWSYEITPPASIALADDNYGDTCYIPQTTLLPDSNVNDILRQLRASDGMDGEEPSASTTNFTGNNQWGNCRNLMPDGSAGTLANRSQFQCGANTGKCDQPYAWPFYYYDKFESRAMGKGNPGGISGIKPQILRVRALADAKTMCSAVTPLSWASTPVEDKKSDSEGEPIVSFPQIAAVWKAAVASEPYGAPDIINNVCAEAIVVAAGECQDVASKDLPPNWKGACKMLQLWGGTGASPDDQAAEILSSSQLGNCNTQTTIPDLWISAGNNNLIDTVFCHMNNNGGVVFGGGMCSGEGAASIGAKLSIYYTGSLASLSCQSAGASAAVTIPKDQTALISGSGSAAKVTCYGSSTVVYTPTGSGADASWKSSASGDACNIVSAGNVTCTASN